MTNLWFPWKSALAVCAKHGKHPYKKKKKPQAKRTGCKQLQKQRFVFLLEVLVFAFVFHDGKDYIKWQAA